VAARGAVGWPRRDLTTTRGKGTSTRRSLACFSPLPRPSPLPRMPGAFLGLDPRSSILSLCSGDGDLSRVDSCSSSRLPNLASRFPDGSPSYSVCYIALICMLHDFYLHSTASGLCILICQVLWHICCGISFIVLTIIW
jgi:hypothetical protein